MTLFRTTLLFIMLAITPAHAQTTVVELFTTSGCPACHPADALLFKLQKENENEKFIAISCHVTAMGDASIDENLAKEECNKRQSFYYNSNTLESASTPMAVMNGLYQVTGGDEKIMRSAIKMVKSTPTIEPITFQRIDKNEIKITLPEITLDPENPAEIWVFSTLKETQAKLKDGTIINYAGLVKDVEKLTNWNGASTAFNIKTEKLQGNRLIILAQYENGKILAAGQTDK